MIKLSVLGVKGHWYGVTNDVVGLLVEFTAGCSIFLLLFSVKGLLWLEFETVGEAEVGTGALLGRDFVRA